MQHPGKSLTEFQQFHKWLDQQKGFRSELWLNTMLLQTEVGELTKEALRYRWRSDEYGPADERVLATRDELGAELADCLAYLLKIANDMEIDLQEAYTVKMLKNINRTWERK